MDATELRNENERLRRELAHAHGKLVQVTAQHAAVTEQFTATLEAKDRQLSALEHQLKLLLRQLRGSRQERIDPHQLLLFSLEELQEIADQLSQGSRDEFLDDDSVTSGEQPRRRKSPGRVGKLPDHLEREIIRHELSEPERVCPGCGGLRAEIGTETSEQLELVPARLRAIEHHRVKYACRDCQEHVVVADKPPQPIEKGLPGSGLCAHTVLGKFGDHTPMYRQEDIHSRLGKTIRRSTLCHWQSQLATLATALVKRMKYLLLQSKVIHTDDTSIRMLQPGQGMAKTCKFWPYLGDWEHPYAVYDFTLTRERDGPQKFLAGFTGYLQADAYSGYDCIYAGDQVQEVACWIHARRYWHRAIDNDPLRANTALGYIARLSQIEQQLRAAVPAENIQGKRDFDAVAGGRRTHAWPILEEFKTWLDEENASKRILPKSPIRQAFTYTLNQWEALVRYTEEGYLSFDNNVAERLVKMPAIGRKNYLFVGSEKGGHGAAIMYSLVSSAKANGVEPFAWLQAIFTELPYYRDGEAFHQVTDQEPVTSTELDHLLPDQWLSTRPDRGWQIDALRRSERERRSKLSHRRTP